MFLGIYYFSGFPSAGYYFFCVFRAPSSAESLSVVWSSTLMEIFNVNICDGSENQDENLTWL